MLDFPRWKVWIVLLTTVLGILLAVPSFFPESTFANWPKWAPHPQIKLGLDLRGGSRLLLEAETADVAKQRIALMEESVRTEMRRASPRIEIGDISVQKGALSFLVRNIAQLDAAVDTARKLTQPVGLTGQRDWDVAVRDSTQIVMTPTAAGLAKSTDDAMNSSRSVIDIRVNGSGISEAGVRREGANRIVVEVPGLKDPEALKALLGKTAKLEFKLVAFDSDPVALAAGQVPPDVELLPYPDARASTNYIIPPKKAGDPPLIAVQRRVMVTGDELTGARPGNDQDGSDTVEINFNGPGGRKFARVTQDNIGKPFAIILDDTVLSAPDIKTAILGGAASISGSFDAKSAKALSVQLEAGKLPVDLKVVDETTVSPELGQDSINSGVLAGVVATLALVVYMLITYFRFGVYTAIALGVNGLMVLGIMALAGATLTLPGIAGFVLTIGAAVDANVLINERIREELRRGRGSMQAVEFGYKEASTAIFDANITNVISAVILFGFGSGPLKGFAVVLAIGIATSVFTGVTLTRLIVSDYMRRNRPKELVL